MYVDMLLMNAIPPIMMLVTKYIFFDGPHDFVFVNKRAFVRQ